MKGRGRSAVGGEGLSESPRHLLLLGDGGRVGGGRGGHPGGKRGGERGGERERACERVKKGREDQRKRRKRCEGK